MLVFLIAGFNSYLIGHKLTLLQMIPRQVRGITCQGTRVGFLVVTKWVCAILVLSIFHRSLNGDETGQVPSLPLPSWHAPLCCRDSSSWNVMPQRTASLIQSNSEVATCSCCSWMSLRCWRIYLVGRHLKLACGKCSVLRLQIMMFYCYSFWVFFVTEDRWNQSGSFRTITAI